MRLLMISYKKYESMKYSFESYKLVFSDSKPVEEMLEVMMEVANSTKITNNVNILTRPS